MLHTFCFKQLVSIPILEHTPALFIAIHCQQFVSLNCSLTIFLIVLDEILPFHLNKLSFNLSLLVQFDYIIAFHCPFSSLTFSSLVVLQQFLLFLLLALFVVDGIMVCIILIVFFSLSRNHQFTTCNGQHCHVQNLVVCEIVSVILGIKNKACLVHCFLLIVTFIRFKHLS